MRLQNRRNRLSKPSSKRGVSLVAVSLLMVGLAVLSLSLFAMVGSSNKANRGSREQLNARYVSQAGLSVALMKLSSGAEVAEVNLGSEQQPVGFGDATFWVSAEDLGGNVYGLTATGVENNVGSRLELVLREVTDSLYVWAAFGDEGLTLDSNAQVDSYNSDLGSYASQDVNGSGSSSYALTNGNVGSNNNVSADSNVKVHGDATPGPGGTATVTGNAVVTGSTAPASDLVDMPDIDLPSLPSMGDMVFDSHGWGPFDSFIPSGSWHFGNTRVTADDLLIKGPATLVFDSFEMRANSGVVVDATDGPVDIYVIGDFVMNSNTSFSSETHTPADLSIHLLSDNVINPQLDVDLDYVDFESNAKLYGTIYAPNASVEINSNFELFGSLVARRVHLDSNARVHFDEALLDVSEDEERTFERVAFRHTPYQP